MAVRKGYYEDAALPLLLEGIAIPSRDPMMLRGYYARNQIMRDMTKRFLDHQLASGSQKRQIVNLGAGFDSLFFHMQREGWSNGQVNYYEVDFLPVFQHKVKAIACHPELLQQLGPEATIDAEKGTLHSPHYHVLPTDLRDIQHLQQQLIQSGLDVQ